jgi:hypothetical protein
MKNYTPALIIVVLLQAGCIKHPEQPPVPRPQWLINKVVQITESYGANPLPGDPPTHISKMLWEIEYNQQYKPFIRRVHYSDGNDTLNLQLKTVDTLSYDAKLRVKQMRTLVLPDGTVTTTSFTYTGNDTLSSRTDILPSGYVMEYAYKGDTVVVTSLDIKGGRDTTRYVYPNGNLDHSLSREYPTIPYVLYDEYDNGPLIERSMNLSQGGLFPLPFTVGATPRLSRSNWTHSVFFYVNRYVQYNGYGLPSASTVQEYFPERRYRCRYEYFETRPLPAIR